MIWFAPFEGLGDDAVVVPFPNAGQAPPAAANADDEDDDAVELPPRRPRAAAPAEPYVPRCSLK